MRKPSASAEVEALSEESYGEEPVSCVEVQEKDSVTSPATLETADALPRDENHLNLREKQSVSCVEVAVSKDTGQQPVQSVQSVQEDQQIERKKGEAAQSNEG